MMFEDVSVKRRYFVTSNDVIRYIFPYNSAMEYLINYFILKNRKFFCNLRVCTQFIPHVSQNT